MKYWYAVISENYSEWDYGSYDLNQARRMMETAGPGAYIAVIDDSTKNPVCVEEIRE